MASNISEKVDYFQLKSVGEKHIVISVPSRKPDLVLCRVSKRLSINHAAQTVKTYLHHILRFLNYLERIPNSVHPVWNVEQQLLLTLVQSFFIDEMGCAFKSAKFNREARIVNTSSVSIHTVSNFLTAIRVLYRELFFLNKYDIQEPLKMEAKRLQESSRLFSLGEQLKSGEPENPRRMPLKSGVEPGFQHQDHYKETDNYYICSGSEWQPKVLDDPDFPNHVWKAGNNFQWRLREQVVARLLFETGARISEICSLTLSDWLGLGGKNQAYSVNKGSHGNRAKELIWSKGTTKLIYKYIDSERYYSDPERLKVSKILSDKINPELLNAPLFLNRYGRSYTSQTFRALYWKPALTKYGMYATPHQCRHWFVTKHIRQIYEEANSYSLDNPEVRSRLNQLISYMKWKQGWKMVETYNHYLSKTNIMLMQDKLHEALDLSFSGKVTTSLNIKENEKLISMNSSLLDDIFNQVDS
ncbi:MAG: hypothetical protein CMF25_03990 [Kangiellaceae bacterium]|nr:hypothetical protein [Kangiellaceae bacterium]|tara:strand:+ start:1681 stop:3093 length:1413 start_codon:yes stop_codon:yes gene_type:complete